MLQALNDEWSIHRQRVHAFENRVPEGVTLLLFSGAILALSAVGFAGGIANHRGAIGKWLLVTLLGATIFIVVDLDRPRRGVFKISQEPIVHVQLSKIDKIIFRAVHIKFDSILEHLGKADGQKVFAR